MKKKIQKSKIVKKTNKTTAKKKLAKATVKKNKPTVKKSAVKKTNKKQVVVEKHVSQYNSILNHLVEKGSITPVEAMLNYGVLRLGAHIYNLRGSGLEIQTTTHTYLNKFNRVSRIAKYVLVNEEI